MCENKMYFLDVEMWCMTAAEGLERPLSSVKWVFWLKRAAISLRVRERVTIKHLMGDEGLPKCLNPLGITIIIRDVFHNIALGQNKWAFRPNKWPVWGRPRFGTGRPELHETPASIKADNSDWPSPHSPLSHCKMSRKSRQRQAPR